MAKNCQLGKGAVSIAVQEKGGEAQEFFTYNTTSGTGQSRGGRWIGLHQKLVPGGKILPVKKGNRLLTDLPKDHANWEKKKKARRK